MLSKEAHGSERSPEYQKLFSDIYIIVEGFIFATMAEESFIITPIYNSNFFT